MASKKIKLTSQTAWETQKDLNENFTDIDNRIDTLDDKVDTLKTSDLTNDGDGSSPFATQDYVDENGGKIDSISVNNVPQTIDANKNVNITVPEDTGATSVDETGSGNAYTGSRYDSATRKIIFTKGETFQTATDNSLNTNNKTVSGAINEVNAVAKAANQAKGFASYSALITDLNSASATEYKVGQSFYVQTKDVPDLWVISVESSSVAYTYIDDATFVTATAAVGGQQVGYYKLAQLETQKVDLSNYATLEDLGETTAAIEEGVAETLQNYVEKTTTIAGVDLQDNITKAELQTALEDTTHRFVTDTEKSTWNAKQDAVSELSFTSDDARWGSVDSNGFYTLTITSAKTPQDVFKIDNNKKQKVCAGLDYDGTYIYVVTDTKFAGVVTVL